MPAGASAGEALEALDSLTRVLRERCPWDQAQSHETIVPHTVEEAFEVADVVRTAGAELTAGALAELEDELGDLLFQVVLLSLLSEEQDAERTLSGVIRRVHDKLVSRHPHIFGDLERETADDVRETWEELKRTREGRSGIFHSLPATYPSTLHARKAQQRAGSVGFDFAALGPAVAKLDEEVAELQAEIPAELERRGDPPGEGDSGAAGDGVTHEVGDVLFAAVNVARLLRVDPELALRDCTRRFVERVDLAAQLAAEDGSDFTELPLDEQEAWYQAAKRSRGEDA